MLEQENKPLSNNEFITGPLLRNMIFCGASWVKKHFSELEKTDRYLGREINDILQASCYEMSNCSSDSVGDILSAAAQGANQVFPGHHQGRPFLFWIVGLAEALKDKQIISTEDFVQALRVAADLADTHEHRLYTPEITTVPRRVAEAALDAATTTSDLHKVINEILEETKLFLDHSRRELEEHLQIALISTDSTYSQSPLAVRVLIATMRASGSTGFQIRKGIAIVSTGLALTIFFEGIQRYIEGKIIPVSIQEKTRRINSWKNEVTKLAMIKKVSKKRWTNRVVVLLERMICTETDDPEMCSKAEMIRDSVHTASGRINAATLEQIQELLHELNATYAPKSLELAQEVYRTFGEKSN
jgi:hypothetical protein